MFKSFSLLVAVAGAIAFVCAQEKDVTVMDQTQQTQTAYTFGQCIPINHLEIMTVTFSKSDNCVLFQNTECQFDISPMFPTDVLEPSKAYSVSSLNEIHLSVKTIQCVAA